MNVVSILKNSLALLRNELTGSVVYLDDWASECILHTIGISSFLKLGVLNVHPLSRPSKRDVLIAKLLIPDSEVDHQSPPIVVFSSQLLYSVEDQINEILNVHAFTKRLLIFCSYSADAHITGLSFDQNAYTQFKAKFESIKKNLDVEVRYFPWMWSALTSEAFILTPELHCLGLGKESAPLLSIPNDARDREIKLLSQALIGMGSHLGVKFDVFTLGSDSLDLGQEVMKLGAPVSLEGPPVEKTAALILIDRSLDLMSPLLHPDSLLDRLLSLQVKSLDPRLTDLSIQLDGKSKLSFFSNEPQELKSLVHHLIDRTCRDGSLYIRKWIREEIRQLQLTSNFKPKPGAPTAQEFTIATEILTNAPQSGRLQAIRALTKASAAALDPETSGRKWEAMMSNERQILVASSNPEDLVQYFLDLIQTSSKKEALLKIPELCSLLTVAYSILLDTKNDPLNPTEERLILEALIQCCLITQDTSLIKEEPKTGQSLSKQKAELRGSINEKWKIIKQLTRSRNSLQTLKKLTSNLTGESVPLLRTLVSLIMENKTIPELHRPTSTFQGLLQGATGAGGALLSKGLGRLGLSRQQESPGSHEKVIIVFVGGLSFHEIQTVHEDLTEQAQNPWKTKIIISGTQLIDSESCLHRIWNLGS